MIKILYTRVPTYSKVKIIYLILQVVNNKEYKNRLVVFVNNWVKFYVYGYIDIVIYSLKLNYD